VSCGHGGICARAGVGVEERPDHRGRVAWRTENPPCRACLLSLDARAQSACAWWVQIVDMCEVSRFADQPGCPGTGEDSSAFRRQERPDTKYDSNAMQSSLDFKLSSVWRNRYGATCQLLALALTFRFGGPSPHAALDFARKRTSLFEIIVVVVLLTADFLWLARQNLRK